MGQPRPLFHFLVFSNKQYYFTTYQCEKMSRTSSIRHQDLNPLPLEHESSQLTTRTGLLPVRPDWAIYWTLGNFLKPLATTNLPKSPTYLGIFVKVSKSIIFLVKSFLGNFYRHLAIFSGHTGTCPPKL